jgi:hypothetical protein
MTTAQAASLGSSVKYVSFTMTTSAKTLTGWLTDSTAIDTATGALPVFSTDNLVAVILTGYTGSLLYGGSNSQPIPWPANADFSGGPAVQAPGLTSVKSASGTFTCYAVVVFGSAG